MLSLLKPKSRKEVLRCTLQWVSRALKRKVYTEADEIIPRNISGDGCQPANVVRWPKRTEYSWTALIWKYNNCGQGREALKVYHEMLKDGVKPSSYTFVAALKACGRLQDLQTARQIHAEVIRRGLVSDLFVGTVLIDVYAKCTSLVDARLAFDNLPRRDVVSWNAMILGYAQINKGEEALQLYTQMLQEGVVPNSRTYVGALKACSSLAQSQNRNGCEDIGVQEKCLVVLTAIHTDLLKRNFELGVILGTMLVDAYAKCGRLADARQVFEQMPYRDAVSWNAMILGYCQIKDGVDALQLYNRMKQEGIRPDSRTFVSALKACSCLIESANRNKGGITSMKTFCVETVSAIHMDSKKQGCDSDVFVATMLIDVYAKCGSLEDARCVFENMSARTVVTWNAMILGYAQKANGGQALQLYTRMQKEGIEPNDQTYMSVMKACITLAGSGRLDESNSATFKQRCLETLRTIHTHVVQSVSSHEILRTKLVDAYAKCGSLEDAMHVFVEMPKCNVNAWNAIISAHTQVDRSKEALELYTRMQREGVVPNEQTFICILKACSTILELRFRSPGEGQAAKERCLEIVRDIHTASLVGKVRMDVCLGTMLIDVYAKSGNLDDARRVFDSISDRTVISWNAMILGYAQSDNGTDAFELFSQMQQEHVAPDARTYVGALKACSTLAGSVDGLAEKEKWLKTVRTIHSDVVEKNCDMDLFVGNMLIDAYINCGGIENARRVFEQMPYRDVVSWNAIILGCAQMDKGEEALQLYIRMQTEGVVPDGWTVVSVLRASNRLAELACTNAGDEVVFSTKTLEMVQFIHKDVLTFNIDLDMFVGTMLVDAYAKCGALKEARQVFDQMPDRTVATWNAMMFGYAQSNDDGALHLFAQMQSEGVVPDARTYVSALKACAVQAEMTNKNGRGDTGDVKKKCLETVRGIHASMKKNNLESDEFVNTMLVDVYAKCDSLPDARLVFEEMPQRDVVSWTVMISGYSQVGRGEEALRLYSRMQQEGVLPDSRTYVAALNACGRLAGLEKGKEIHAQVLKAGLVGVDIFVTESLISMYSKCGSMVDARQVFDGMLTTRGIVAWNSLMSGYAHLGDCDAVFDLLDRMQQEGMHPDGITFLSVLTACSHAGLVDRGQQYFNAMSTDYGITPTLTHMTCVVDLLGRAGHLVKAMEIVNALPLQPCGALWRCVLGACWKWGNVDLGKQAFESAINLNKNDAAAYVLMSNIYAACHMWKEADAMQTKRVQSGAWKQPGQSWWMDMTGVVHVFSVGDQGHPANHAIQNKSKELLARMKRQGYVPHLDSVLRDIPDDEKENALNGHSERLALCYALLQTPEGTTIRVVKNLRVCDDCHRAIAVISRIEQRIVICRDVSRFHIFMDGKCSCGDYW